MFLFLNLKIFKFMGTYHGIEEFFSTPNFDNILGLVKRSYCELKKDNPDLKGKSLRDAFVEILEHIYKKYSSFDSFQGVFTSLSDFKSKVSKALSKNNDNQKLSRGNQIKFYQNEIFLREQEEQKMLDLLNREDW